MTGYPIDQLARSLARVTSRRRIVAALTTLAVVRLRADATDARRAEQQTRQGTKKANKRSRKDRKQARRRARNDSRNDAPGAADRDCTDFATQQEAQDFWDRKGYSSTNDPHGLDPDGNGIPCEDLPKR
jgi:hypothetical protein